MKESRNVSGAMIAAGHTEEEISAARREALRLGYVEPAGLGMDRLTPAGKGRTIEIWAGDES